MGQSSMAKKRLPRDAVSKVAQQRLSVLKLARESGNVAEAGRQRGMDRTSFHEWKRRFHPRRGLAQVGQRAARVEGAALPAQRLPQQAVGLGPVVKRHGVFHRLPPRVCVRTSP